MIKKIIYTITLAMLFSCGKTADQKTADAVLSASIALSKGNCQEAITVLEENGRVNTNASYLKTLASAYACRAGYSTLTFFTTDISKTVTPAPLGGTTTYTTSSEAVTTTLSADSSYQDLQTAINILLYAGGISTSTEPTTAERKTHFTTAEVADMDSQLLYMILVQLGRYGYFYGDSSATGVKGSGSGSNTCFSSYVNAHANVKADLTAAAGTCTDVATTTSGHSQLVEGVAAATRKTRMCEGVVLMNNVYALLPNIIASIFSNPADQASVNAALADITAAKAAMTAADPDTATVATTLNQSVCENNTSVPVSALEGYFAIMFEGSFQ